MATEREESGITYREITREEAWALLDADTRRRLGVRAEESARHYHAVEYDDPNVMELAMRLEFLERAAPAPS